MKIGKRSFFFLFSIFWLTYCGEKNIEDGAISAVVTLFVLLVGCCGFIFCSVLVVVGIIVGLKQNDICMGLRNGFRQEDELDRTVSHASKYAQPNFQPVPGQNQPVVNQQFVQPVENQQFIQPVINQPIQNVQPQFQPIPQNQEPLSVSQFQPQFQPDHDSDVKF